MPINITLTMPPSTNALYRYTTKGRVSFAYRTNEYKKWIADSLKSLSMQVKHNKIISGDTYVGIHYFLKFNRDIDNGKAILDLLEHAGLIVNDKQVTFMNLRKEFDKENPRVEVDISVL